MTDAAHLGTENTATDTASVATDAADEPKRRPSLGDQLILKRDLNEAYLLLDFLSGRPDKSLQSLTLADPHDPTKTLKAAEIVQSICSFRYPPSEDDVIRAENACFLLLTKDELSRLAAPARSVSIAYTTMFSDAGAPLLHRRGHYENRDARLSLAVEAFGAMRPHATSFRRMFSWLPLFALLWLALTVLTYWQVALGQSVLQRLQQFYKERTTLIQDNVDVLESNLCPTYQPGDVHITALPASPDARKVASACIRPWQIDKSTHEASVDLSQTVNCGGFWPHIVSHALGWKAMLCDGAASGAGAAMPRGPKAASASDATPDRSNSDQVGWQSATSVLSVLSTYVLPMMFSILGTLIAVMRNVHGKLQNSELAPRDRMLMLISLPMGAIAGVAVGLFFSPTTVASPEIAGPAGNLTLTASGIGFLAGFGAEAFFRLLDWLKGKVFAEQEMASPPAPARPRQPIQIAQPAQSTTAVNPA
jgi:hypothetical protein